IGTALFAYGCKAVVMACNISSAVGLAEVRAAHPENAAFGMIAPGACRASRSTRNGRIGVLATAGTVQSCAYTRGLRALDPGIVVVEVPCPDFVPLVEAGAEESDAAREAADRYLSPIREAGCDTVILGCTHYPFLLGALCNAWSAPVYVDPAEQAALDLADHLASAALLAPASVAIAHLLTTTGDLEAFRAGLARFLPSAGDCARIALATWAETGLALPTA
ncbi:MAG TPA: aspartate/glutamate racemase family protein, partial [Stellaceae bacterium]|nr:aspartate/glutamate racemase family protein [Stellaceae bacterium]